MGEERDENLCSVGSGLTPLDPSPSASGLIAQPSGDAVSRADLACLAAAKSNGLIRKNAGALMCPGSATPAIGWWAKASWSDYDGDAGKGGPWSAERVFRLCEIGLLGVSHREESRARLTRDGSRLLTAIRKKASQSPVASDGEASNSGEADGVRPNPNLPPALLKGEPE